MTKSIFKCLEIPEGKTFTYIMQRVYEEVLALALLDRAERHRVFALARHHRQFVT